MGGCRSETASLIVSVSPQSLLQWELKNNARSKRYVFRPALALMVQPNIRYADTYLLDLSKHTNTRSTHALNSWHPPSTPSLFGAPIRLGIVKLAERRCFVLVHLSEHSSFIGLSLSTLDRVLRTRPLVPLYDSKCYNAAIIDLSVMRCFD
ncbi:Uncharacterized protein HZ326_29121 [Fusarium oxysporum f. sp. albedinis]|nr:Uncharacterized protein HZ326_29121 [Fusarium oxysporum f. sp. albedinis]